MVKILEPSFELYEGEEHDDPIDGFKMLRKIERFGRIAHQSFPKMMKNIDEAKKFIIENYNKCGRDYQKDYPTRTEKQIYRDASTISFIKMILETDNGRGHLSVIEHASISVIFIFDRGCSHELVRHRLSSFTQESTRFNLYSSEKFGHQIQVIRPYWLKEGTEDYNQWLEIMQNIEKAYLFMTSHGNSAQQARSVLPNCLKTEIAMTTNLRVWKEVVLTLRTEEKAHPQMRQVMIPLLRLFQRKIPLIFDKIPITEKATEGIFT